jgi:hypothetical protein
MKKTPHRVSFLFQLIRESNDKLQRSLALPAAAGRSGTLISAKRKCKRSRTLLQAYNAMTDVFILIRCIFIDIDDLQMTKKML